MGSSSPDSNNQEENSFNYSIHQDNDGNVDGGQQASIGDNNTLNQDNRRYETNVNINFSSGSELPDGLEFVSWKARLINYLRTLLVLLFALASWSFMGLGASQSFPVSTSKKLLTYTLFGFWENVSSPADFLVQSSDRLWTAVRYGIENLKDFSEISITNNKMEATRLNRLDSEYWLLSRLAEELAAKTKETEDIFVRVRELQEQRNLAQKRLEKLREVYFENLLLVQKLAKNLTFFLDIHSNQRRIEELLNSKVIDFVDGEDFSDLRIQELVEDLRASISTVPQSQSIYNVWRLVDWVHVNSRKRLEVQSSMDIDYPPYRALKTSNKYHIKDGCMDDYPKVEKDQDITRIDFYETQQEAEESGRKMCEKCRKRVGERC